MENSLRNPGLLYEPVMENCTFFDLPITDKLVKVRGEMVIFELVRGRSLVVVAHVVFPPPQPM